MITLFFVSCYRHPLALPVLTHSFPTRRFSDLKGLAGTIDEGMTLAYGRDTSDAGAAAKDITITTTLGIAERLYQRLENYGNAGDGLITEEINRLSAQNLDTTDKIATLEARLVIYQNTLIEKIGRAHV